MARPRQRILIVEENHAIRSQLVQGLKAAGYQPLVAVDGLEGLVQFEREQPDLLLLNLHLPGLNGAEMCRRIRLRSTVPIIMLSILRDEAVKIAALDQGVDNYLLIPFKVDELVAWIRAALRRSSWSQRSETGVIRVGNLEIDLEGRQLLRDGQNLRLSRTEWKLLGLLISHPRRVLTHATLSQSIWGDGPGEDNTALRVMIGRLRKKLEADPANPQHLLTEPGIGYYFGLPNQEPDIPPQLLTGEAVPQHYLSPLTNIPSERASFIGREEEIAQLNDLLERPDVRLVTLIGLSGSGKTRLSLQVARALEGCFEQGIALAPLAAISDVTLAQIRIAQVLGLKERSGESLVEDLKQFLRDRKILLILDSFERVVTAAPLVAELLDASRDLKLLITSTLRLNIAGEHVFEVPPLPLPNPAHLPDLEALRRIPSIALFTERAQAIRPDFMLTADNAQAVAQICVQLAGLPLAIELATARIKILSPEAMLARLRGNLSLLVGGERDRPERQQTVRNMIDWSYNLLGDPEKTLFSQLAVFSGGFTLEAAEAVCIQDEHSDLSIIDGILSLLNKSMLQQHVELLLESYSVTRFSMLTLILEFALERLKEADAVGALRARHMLYYLALAERAEVQLPSPQEKMRLIQLESERDNLQAAIQFALDQGNDDCALRLCAALWKFWHAEGRQSEGRYWLGHTLASTPDTQTPARVKALYGLGWMHFDQGDFDQAETCYDESLALARALNDQMGIAEALHGVGEMARLHGDYLKALGCFEESLAHFRSLGHKEGIAWSLDHLGRLVHHKGDHQRAVTMIEEAISLFREIGLRSGTGYMIGNLGVILLRQGNLEPARRYLEQCLSLHQKVGDKHGIAVFLIRVAEVALLQGEAEKAYSLLTTCLSLSQEWGYRWYTALALNQLAQVAILRQDYDQARMHLSEALDIFRDTPNNMEGIVVSLEGFAELAAAQQQIAMALRLYSAAVAQRHMKPLSLPPTNQIREERIIDMAHTYLSQAEFATAWTEGQATGYQTLLNEQITY